MNDTETKEPWGIRRACPQQFNLEAPLEITSQEAYRDIEDWWWYQLAELSEFVAEKFHDAVRQFGPPEEPPPWLEASQNGFNLIESFGPLMKGNKWENRRCPNYTYVRHIHGRLTHSKGDFCLQGTEFPNPWHCKNRWIYVSAGWGNEILKLIPQRVYKVVFNDSKPQTRFLQWEPVEK